MARHAVLSLTVCFFVALSSAAARMRLNLHDCGTSPRLSLISAYMEADEIPFGKDVVFSVTGSTQEDVTGGTYVVTVARKFFGRRFVMLTLKGSVCEYLEEYKDCTVKGESVVTLHITQQVPPLVLPGVYYVKALIMDTNGKQMACFDLEVPIKQTAGRLPV